MTRSRLAQIAAAVIAKARTSPNPRAADALLSELADELSPEEREQVVELVEAAAAQSRRSRA